MFTESNGFGETTKSPEGTQLTVGATNQPQFTFPSLKTGNTSRNLYLGAVGGSPADRTRSMPAASRPRPIPRHGGPGERIRDGTADGQHNGLTYVDSNGITHNKRLELLRACKDGNFEDVYQVPAAR